jgi:hypothetical protein
MMRNSREALAENSEHISGAETYVACFLATIRQTRREITSLQLMQVVILIVEVRTSNPAVLQNRNGRAS